MAKVKTTDITVYDELDRAWLLIKTDQDPTMLNKKYFEPDYLKDEGFFIVRADEVNTGTKGYNLMVPVYYFVDDDTDGLKKAKKIFKKAEFITAVVTRLDSPKKHHHAKGYIPYIERNPKRPGPRDWNTWG